MLETREIAGFKVTKKKAEKLYDYITKPVKDGKTQFELDDSSEARMLYAMFAMDGFNKDSLEREVKTTQAKTLKKKLSNTKDKAASMKGQPVRRENNDKLELPDWM